MSMRAQTEVHALTAKHAAAYANLRRRALETDPLAFAIPVAGDPGASLDAVESALAELPRDALDCILGAFALNLVGVVGVTREPAARHRIRLWGLYVISERRGCGIGQSLLSGAYDRSRRVAGAEQLLARVPAASAATIRLLEHFGFEAGDVDRGALDESSVAWVALTLNLPDEAA